MPAAWQCAQRTAANLIERAWKSPPPLASFEYRATHDVLSLTILLLASAREQREDLLCAAAAVVDYDLEWALWCSTALAQAPAHLSPADFDAANSAWEWLTHSRLFGDDPFYRPGGYADAATRSGAGLTIGVALVGWTLLDGLGAGRRPPRNPR